MSIIYENIGVFAVITLAIIVWDIFVILYISKKIYQFFDKQKKCIPGEYIARKTIHILAGGVTALLIPIVFIHHLEVAIMLAFLMAAYVYYRREKSSMYWFQMSNNFYEVDFCVVYGFMILIGWLSDNIWLGLTPILFMTFGDGITGIVRALRQKQHIKSWDGTLAMFILCSVIGFLVFGWIGIVIAMAVSVMEKISWFDDNITVPFTGAFLIFFYSSIA